MVKRGVGEPCLSEIRLFKEADAAAAVRDIEYKTRYFQTIIPLRCLQSTVCILICLTRPGAARFRHVDPHF
jgi:hypothetical protein